MRTCVVIPVYKNMLSNFEKISLQQTAHVLSDFDIYFCEPQSLDSEKIRNKYPVIKVEKFEDDFFKGIIGYNKLMLSTCFYERFEAYDYMLLCQLDAYVFKNDLEFWTNKGYDYIGSPWLTNPDTIFKKIKRLFASNIKKEREEIFFKVGNGGFSLRKIKTFKKILKENPDKIQQQLSIPEKSYKLMEDIFWSLEAPKLEPNFVIPGYQEAIYFSLDRRPKLGFKLTNGEYPFGCHGFNKNNVLNFWKSKIPKLNIL